MAVCLQRNMVLQRARKMTKRQRSTQDNALSRPAAIQHCKKHILFNQHSSLQKLYEATVFNCNRNVSGSVVGSIFMCTTSICSKMVEAQRTVLDTWRNTAVRPPEVQSNIPHDNHRYITLAGSRSNISSVSGPLFPLRLAAPELFAGGLLVRRRGSVGFSGHPCDRSSSTHSAAPAPRA